MQRNKNTWHPSLDENLPDSWREWLNFAGSFMQRLAHHGIEHARIDVLREAWFQPEAWERELLGLALDDLAWVREVRIFSEKGIWLYARTVVTPGMLEHKQELSRLRDRSLGSVLFDDPDIRREKFEFIFTEMRKLWRDFSHLHESSWVRRSKFNLNNRSLLLTEILMPDLTTLCVKN